MKLIFTVDDNFGIGFNHRGQSRDKAVISDLLELTEGNVHIVPYSENLFESLPQQSGDWYFVEREVDPDIVGQADMIVLYKWKRNYPADSYLRFNPEEWKLVSRNAFACSSHEKIEREIYEKKT